MFVTFHLSISFVVDADLRSVWGLLPGFGTHCTVHNFCECFGKSLYGRNLLLTIQNLFLLPRDIRFSTNKGVYPPVYSEYTEGSRSSRMLMYACVCVGGNVCSLRVRGLSRRRH